MSKILEIFKNASLLNAFPKSREIQNHLLAHHFSCVWPFSPLSGSRASGDTGRLLAGLPTLFWLVASGDVGRARGDKGLCVLADGVGADPLDAFECVRRRCISGVDCAESVCSLRTFCGVRNALFKGLDGDGGVLVLDSTWRSRLRLPRTSELDRLRSAKEPRGLMPIIRLSRSGVIDRTGRGVDAADNPSNSSGEPKRIYFCSTAIFCYQKCVLYSFLFFYCNLDFVDVLLIYSYVA